MAALMTRAAAMTLAAGVTFTGAAALAPGLATAAPSDLSFGHCTPTTSPLKTCDPPKVRAGSTKVEVGQQLSFELSNLLAESKYKITADAYTLMGNDSKGLADQTGDDKRGYITGNNKADGLTVPLNLFLGDSAHIDPKSGTVTLTFSQLFNNQGKSSPNLKLKFTITKATDTPTIKKLRAAAASAKSDEDELSYLLNIASSKRDANDKSEIARIEKETKSKTSDLGPNSVGRAAVVAAPVAVGAVTPVLTPASASRPAAPSHSLAFTGAEIAGMSVVGLGLLGTGAFLVVGGRRRKGTAA